MQIDIRDVFSTKSCYSSVKECFFTLYIHRHERKTIPQFQSFYSKTALEVCGFKGCFQE